MTTEDMVFNIKAAIKASEQVSIFDASDKELNIDNACIDYLKYKGYRIIAPKRFDVKIKNIDHLITYFYSRLNSKYKEGYTTSLNKAADRAIAKRFVDDRVAATGVCREYALNECAEIIKTVFDNEKEFNFKYEIKFSVFGQKNLKWVTDKAISILNRRVISKEEESIEKLQKKMIEAQGTEDLGYSNIDELLAKFEGE